MCRTRYALLWCCFEWQNLACFSSWNKHVFFLPRKSVLFSSRFPYWVGHTQVSSIDHLVVCFLSELYIRGCLATLVLKDLGEHVVEGSLQNCSANIILTEKKMKRIFYIFNGITLASLSGKKMYPMVILF